MLRRNGGFIYLCFLLRPVGFFFSKILHLCHLGATKSACPTDAEKCLPTAICPYSRWRSQPLSRVRRKQRYNTLDFPRESRVPRKALPSFGNLPPRGTLFPSRLPLPTWMLLAPIGWTQSQRGFAPLDTSPVRAVAIHPAPAQWWPHTRTEKTKHENPPRIRVNFRAWFIVYDAVI